MMDRMPDVGGRTVNGLNPENSSSAGSGKPPDPAHSDYRGPYASQPAEAETSTNQGNDGVPSTEDSNKSRRIGIRGKRRISIGKSESTLSAKSRVPPTGTARPPRSEDPISHITSEEMPTEAPELLEEMPTEAAELYIALIPLGSHSSHTQERGQEGAHGPDTPVAEGSS